MRQISRIIAAALLATAGFAFVACHHPHEGPAQHVGSRIDHTADKAGDAIEHTGRTINRALPGD